MTPQVDMQTHFQSSVCTGIFVEQQIKGWLYIFSTTLRDSLILFHNLMGVFFFSFCYQVKLSERPPGEVSALISLEVKLEQQKVDRPLATHN